ncbi:MAG TPA: hypothetical protein VLA48_03470 [Nitrososphaeraceae archaeon]|nr:hypothetical protein [Nitrososphaeraceae archaeon]
MKLEDKFRERLLGQLSDANTEVDVRNAVEVCKQEILLFHSFLRENCFEIFNSGLYYIRDSEKFQEAYSIEELLEIYLKQE